MMDNWIDQREIRNVNVEVQVDEKYKNNSCIFASM